MRSVCVEGEVEELVKYSKGAPTQTLLKSQKCMISTQSQLV